MFFVKDEASLGGKEVYKIYYFSQNIFAQESNINNHEFLFFGNMKASNLYQDEKTKKKL
jgi:hypothetical protein